MMVGDVEEFIGLEFTYILQASILNLDEIQARWHLKNQKFSVYPIVSKVGGLESQGARGEAVVNLLRTLGNEGSGILRLSRRVNNMTSN